MNKVKRRLAFPVFFWSCVLLAFPAATGCGRQEAEFLEAQGVIGDTAEPDRAETGIQVSSLPEKTEAGADPEQEKDMLYVDVCGAVVNPGVYELDPGSRVFQAVEAAGGYAPEADADYVNRAQSVEDGQQVYIPTCDETAGRTFAEREISAGTPASAQADDRVNLNTADAAALMTLTGIGESKAAAIIAYREENGGFSSAEEIQKVPGIKEGTYMKIKDHIVVG